MIGACATLIWEEFKKRGFAEKISETSARLLLTAIISNTLNFGAQITNQRDITAYGELRNYANLPDDWSSTYFSDQEKAVHTNVKEAIEGDTKVLTVPTLPFPLVIGQMELWDSGAFLMGHLDEIKEVLAGFGHEHWILTLPSIGEKKNYLYTENSEMQEVFSKIIGAKFENNIGTTDKLWLRKEIRKKLHEYK
jgi:inorganic pyrophosphatase/exopolyphosphatase